MVGSQALFMFPMESLTYPLFIVSRPFSVGQGTPTKLSVTFTTHISETHTYIHDLTVTNVIFWYYDPIQMQVFQLYFQIPFMAQS